MSFQYSADLLSPHGLLTLSSVFLSLFSSHDFHGCTQLFHLSSFCLRNFILTSQRSWWSSPLFSPISLPALLVAYVSEYVCICFRWYPCLRTSDSNLKYRLIECRLILLVLSVQDKYVNWLSLNYMFRKYPCFDDFCFAQISSEERDFWRSF